MGRSRRMVLKGAAALSLVAGHLPSRALAQAAPAAAPGMPPLLFVHGNGDHAALGIATLWRTESNGVPRERMLAINFTNPRARNDDAVGNPAAARP